MENKYNMTIGQNIFLAKRNLVDNIYSNARLEGLNITFPQTKTILEGINVPELKIDEIQCILNLRDAWSYVINNIETEFNLEFISKVNEFVARNESIAWGKLRNGKVEITGTTYIPQDVLTVDWDNKRYLYPIPYSEVIKNKNMVQNPNW